MSPIALLLFAGALAPDRPPLADEWGYHPADGASARTNPPSMTWDYEKEATGYGLKWADNPEFRNAGSVHPRLFVRREDLPKLKAYIQGAGGLRGRDARVRLSAYRRAEVPGGCTALLAVAGALGRRRTGQLHPELRGGKAAGTPAGPRLRLGRRRAQQSHARRGEACVEAADQWLDFAVTKFYAAYPVWADEDGGWHEGLAYLAGYMSKAAWWMDLSRTPLGIDAFQNPFFRQLGDYALYSAPPGSPDLGMGDHSFRPPGQG